MPQNNQRAVWPWCPFHWPWCPSKFAPREGQSGLALKMTKFLACKAPEAIAKVPCAFSVVYSASFQYKLIGSYPSHEEKYCVPSRLIFNAFFFFTSAQIFDN